MRRRFKGHDVFVSGCATSAAAKKRMEERLAELTCGGKAKGFGPHETTVAQALQDYATERLIFMKGAVQEANRINRFLRPAGMATLKLLRVEPSGRDLCVHDEPALVTDSKGKGQLFRISLQAPVAMRAIPRGLGKHRHSLAVTTAASDSIRQRLARMTMADVQPHHVQELMDACRAENREPATLQLERALIRRLFNYSRDCWSWKAPQKNPGTGLTMPSVDNGRERVMSMEEQARLDAAVQGCRNSLVGPTLTLLRESAMRSSEPLEHARWKDVNWDRKILSLSDAKAGKRDVPLSPAAIDALRQLWDLGRGMADDPIVHISYEALKASWKHVCERAGVEGLRLQDLRHTAATRMALRTGNVFLVKALTGPRTLSQVARYVNVKAADVVNVMHAAAPLQTLESTPLQFVERVGEPPLMAGAGRVQEIGFLPEWKLE
jgi:integrase